MRIILDYDKELKEAYLNNLSIVKKDINKKYMIIKIQNFCKKFDFSFNEIKKKILNDNIFASFFIKDPKRQNIYENEAMKYLKKFFPNIEKLSSAGANAKYIIDGEIITGLNRKPVGHKSIDFWVKEKDLYISHKYIEVEGGAQDNQFNDILNFLKNTSNKHNFMAICDGPYFSNRKFSELKKYADSSVFICEINEAPDIINKL